MRFEDLSYTEEDLEKDAVHYLKTQVYEPSFTDNIKKFIAADLKDFQRNYDDAEYAYCNVFYDEYQKGYTVENDEMIPVPDKHKLEQLLWPIFESFGAEKEYVTQYTDILETEFKKNTFSTHMEPFFLPNGGVIATSVVAYTRNPLFSVYAIVREWCMALHIKNMYPQLMRKFGLKYQNLRRDDNAEAKASKMDEFRDKYKHTLQHIGVLRAIHSSVFAYAYMFLCGVRTNETATAERFIFDNSSSAISLLLQGESVRNFDYPITKYVIDKFKEGLYKEFLFDDNTINWNELYKFTLDAINKAGFDNVRLCGFESIEARVMREYWNKSPNMQSMLKVLRNLALEGNNPVINGLIEMCEYRLGRPDKKREKLEHFLEETRRLLRERHHKTKTYMIAQDLVSMFPSVFLVYFQWHHNFRNIYPKVPKKKINEELHLQKVRADEQLILSKKSNETLKNMLLKDALKYQQQQSLAAQQSINKQKSQTEKLRAILQNREKTANDMAMLQNKKNATLTMVDRSMQYSY
jgi:hypothetical protein